MSNKTINQALRDLFLGLGGDASALADNTSVSDYIADLESAIKEIVKDALPSVTSNDNGKVLGVNNAEWDKVPQVQGGYFYENAQTSGSSDISFGDIYLTDANQDYVGQFELALPKSFFLPIFDDNLVDNAVLIWDSNDSQFYPATLSIENGEIVYTKLV